MSPHCDLINRDVTDFADTGSPRFTADAGVTGDRVAAGGNLGKARADREIIATGTALAPGFIDAHTHDDRAVHFDRSQARRRRD
jgi:N-acyl-D-amino-acid deacylase